MYTISDIFVLMSVVVYTNAAVAIYPAREKPAEFADQDGCYLEHLQKVIPYGDYHQTNSCSKYTCHTSNMVQFVTCGVQVIDQGSPCELISDESRDFPDCCPWVMCHTIPPENVSLNSSHKTTDVPVVEHLTTSERAEEETTDVPVVEPLATSERAEKQMIDIPVLGFLLFKERGNKKTTESISEETTALPVVERQTTSENAVAKSSDAPTQYRSINDETMKELLIAQASINTP